MPEVIFALLRTLNTLMQGKVWRAVLAPAVFSLVLWLGLAWWGLASLVGWLMDMPPMTLLVAWGAIWVAQLLAYMGAWMLIFALAYLTSSVLAAIFIMPSLIDQMLKTGEGYDADDVRTYIQARIAGQNPQRPALKKWQA